MCRSWCREFERPCHAHSLENGCGLAGCADLVKDWRAESDSRVPQPAQETAEKYEGEEQEVVQESAYAAAGRQLWSLDGLDHMMLSRYQSAHQNAPAPPPDILARASSPPAGPPHTQMRYNARVGPARRVVQLLSRLSILHHTTRCGRSLSCACVRGCRQSAQGVKQPTQCLLQWLVRQAISSSSRAPVTQDT